MRCQRQMVDSRRIGAIGGRLIAGVSARLVIGFDRRHISTIGYRVRIRITFGSHSNRIRVAGISARELISRVAVRCYPRGYILGSKALPCIQLLLQAGQYKSVGCRQGSKWSIGCRQSSKGWSAAGRAARVYCNSRHIGAIIVWFVVRLAGVLA